MKPLIIIAFFLLCAAAALRVDAQSLSDIYKNPIVSSISISPANGPHHAVAIIDGWIIWQGTKSSVLTTALVKSKYADAPDEWTPPYRVETAEGPITLLTLRAQQSRLNSTYIQGVGLDGVAGGNRVLLRDMAAGCGWFEAGGTDTPLYEQGIVVLGVGPPVGTTGARLLLGKYPLGAIGSSPGTLDLCSGVITADAATGDISVSGLISWPSLDVAALTPAGEVGFLRMARAWAPVDAFGARVSGRFFVGICTMGGGADPTNTLYWNCSSSACSPLTNSTGGILKSRGCAADLWAHPSIIFARTSSPSSLLITRSDGPDTWEDFLEEIFFGIIGNNNNLWWNSDMPRFSGYRYQPDLSDNLQPALQVSGPGSAQETTLAFFKTAADGSVSIDTSTALTTAIVNAWDVSFEDSVLMFSSQWNYTSARSVQSTAVIVRDASLSILGPDRFIVDDLRYCAVGTEAVGPAASQVCVPCPPGTYNPGESFLPCFACPEGTYTNATGSTAETDCLACLRTVNEQCTPGSVVDLGTLDDFVSPNETVVTIFPAIQRLPELDLTLNILRGLLLPVLVALQIAGTGMVIIYYFRLYETPVVQAISTFDISAGFSKRSAWGAMFTLIILAAGLGIILSLANIYLSPSNRYETITTLPPLVPGDREDLNVVLGKPITATVCAVGMRAQCVNPTMQAIFNGRLEDIPYTVTYFAVNSTCCLTGTRAAGILSSQDSGLTFRTTFEQPRLFIQAVQSTMLFGTLGTGFLEMTSSIDLSDVIYRFQWDTGRAPRSINGSIVQDINWQGMVYEDCVTRMRGEALQQLSVIVEDCEFNRNDSHIVGSFSVSEEDLEVSVGTSDLTLVYDLKMRPTDGAMIQVSRGEQHSLAEVMSTGLFLFFSLLEMIRAIIGEFAMMMFIGRFGKNRPNLDTMKAEASREEKKKEAKRRLQPLSLHVMQKK